MGRYKPVAAAVSRRKGLPEKEQLSSSFRSGRKPWQGLPWMWNRVSGACSESPSSYPVSPQIDTKKGNLRFLLESRS